MIDLTALPNCPFRRRARILAEVSPAILETSVEFIKSQYAAREFLEECLGFALYNLEETPTFDGWNKLGFFPWMEAVRDFDQAISLIMLSQYKSSIDHMRRALELVVVGAYFASPQRASQDAARWLASERDTPFFKSAVTTLSAEPVFQELDRAMQWSSALKAFYWELCDIVHTKGVKASYRTVQPSSVHLGDMSVPQFSAASLVRALDLLIQTVRHAATIVAASNPILLAGLPLDEKFGHNSPISGFFNEPQSERLHAVVLDDAKPFFRSLVNSDGHTRDVARAIEALPNLTEKDLAEQATAFRASLGIKDDRKPGA